MVKKLTELSHGCAKSSKTLARFHTVSNLVRKSENEHRVARLASKDATIRWLWALADERDAQLDVAQSCVSMQLTQISSCRSFPDPTRLTVRDFPVLRVLVLGYTLELGYVLGLF